LQNGSQDSSVSIVTRLLAGRLITVSAERGIFLFATRPHTSRLALVPTQPPIQCVQGALSPGVKRTYLHLLPRLRFSGAIPPLPQYVFMARCLVKHRDNCIFTNYRNDVNSNIETSGRFVKTLYSISTVVTCPCLFFATKSAINAIFTYVLNHDIVVCSIVNHTMMMRGLVFSVQLRFKSRSSGL